MVDDTSLSDSDFFILVVYLVFRLEISKISYMSTPFFYTRLIDMEVSNLTQLVIGSDSQPYKNN